MLSSNDDIEILGENGSREMPFAIPEGYFKSFPERLMGRVLAQSRNDVPDGYFETLPGRLLATIRSNNEVMSELEEVAPVLSKISREMPYEVPSGYFEMPVALPQQKKNSNGGKIISIRKLSNWAVAAALLALVVLTIWPNIKPAGDSPSADIASQLAGLPDDAFDALADVKDAPGIHSFEVGVGWQSADNALNNFTEEELQQYLQQSGLDALYDN